MSESFFPCPGGLPSLSTSTFRPLKSVIAASARTPCRRWVRGTVRRKQGLISKAGWTPTGVPGFLGKDVFGEETLMRQYEEKGGCQFSRDKFQQVSQMRGGGQFQQPPEDVVEDVVREQTLEGTLLC